MNSEPPIPAPSEYPQPPAEKPSSRRVMRLVQVASVLLVLVGAGVVLLMLPRVPGSASLASANSLRTAQLRLELAMARQDAGAPAESLAAVIAQVDGSLAQMRTQLGAAELELPELGALELQWQQWHQRGGQPLEPALQSLREQGALTERLVTSLQAQLDARLESLHRSLKVLVGVLALAFVAAVAAYTAQRRQWRSQLRHFSDELGAGNWQGAVETLRSRTGGTPSTFGALATGVESVLGQAERRWQALAELSADWYWETDRENRLSWLSRHAPFLTEQGWTTDDVLGRRHDQITFFKPPGTGWLPFHEKLGRRLSFRDVEFQVAHKRTYQARWVSLSGRPRHDAQGRFMGYEGVGRDISERREAHERLMASEQRWSMMAGLASDWYWETDGDHQVLPLRPELRLRYGELFEPIEGKTLWDAYRGALTPAEWTEHRAEMDAHRPFKSLQLEVEVADGRYMWMSLSGIPRRDAQGRFRGYHGVGRDITARKEAERLLMRHNEALQRAVGERTRELEQINRDLDAFSRQLAHELRTPITQIQGVNDLLLKRLGAQLRTEETEMMVMQMQATNQMQGTLDALLTLARSTLLPMPREEVDLSALARQVVADLPDQNREGRLQWQIQDGIRVLGSEPALRIVLINLLGNAAKFTRQVALAEVCLDAEHGNDEDSHLRIFITDNGPGFPADRQGELFQPFKRLHNGQGYAGTGIGLTIVQRIIERHSGIITAQNRPEGGACFEFTLEAVPLALAGKQQRLPLPLSGLPSGAPEQLDLEVA